MAKLSTRARDKLPAKDFAGPGRSYPIEDKAHARNAKARASEMEHKGRISKATEDRIDRKADAKLENKKHIDQRDHHKGHKSHGEKHMEHGHMGHAVKHLEKDKHMFEGHQRREREK